MTPDPYRDTGKTCLGGGTYCPSASSFCEEIDHSKLQGDSNLPIRWRMMDDGDV